MSLTSTVPFDTVNWESPPFPTRVVPFVTVKIPRLPTFKAFRVLKGVSVPALSWNVFVESGGADTDKLLIVIVPGKLPDVVASIVTVFVVPLVTRIADCVLVGGTPSDQL